jgi:pyruvate kinase
MDDKRIQTLPIATNVVSLNSAHGKVYSMQNYVINFASDIRQVGGVLQVLLFHQLIKIDHHNMAELLLKVALITINLTLSPLKQLIPMTQDLVGIIYGRSSIRIANFVSIR